jgi:zeaxanthin glucosyltransferase
MSRILFVTLPESGHLNPIIGVMQHLVRGGQEVALATILHIGGATIDVPAQLERAGLECPCFSWVRPPRLGPAPPRPPGRTLPTLDELPHRILRDVATSARWLREIVRDFRPDALCIDPNMLPAALVAEQERLPWAALSPSLVSAAPDELHFPWLEEARELNGAFEQFAIEQQVHLGLVASQLVSPWLNIYCTSKLFAPCTGRLTRGSFHIGPCLPLGERGDEIAFPWDVLNPQAPLVYVAAGSQLSFEEHELTAMTQALCPQGVQLVLAVPDAARRAALRQQVPREVVMVERAPQLALLDRCALMINHGGSNSVHECLSRGKPMVILPFCNDQPIQAHFLVTSGAGASLERAELTGDRLREVVTPMLAIDSPTRLRAEQLGRELRASGGAAAGSALVLELASGRRALTV